jgi:hypothetical protein
MTARIGREEKRGEERIFSLTVKIEIKLETRM